MQTRLVRLVGTMLVLCAVFHATLVRASDVQERKHYVRLAQSQPVESGSKIEVIEFFSYACPHCAHFEPLLGPWLKKVPADVQFRRIPALFKPGWPELARAYYTLETLCASERLSNSVFDAIHKNNVPLKDESLFFDWAAKQGLDKQKVAELYHSFGVNSRVARAKSQAQSYRIEGVPGVVIDGKFLVDIGNIGSYATALDVADTLIVKARQERSQASRKI